MKPKPPPPVEQPWAAWKSTEADTESTALRLTVQIVKAATQILPGGSLHAGKTAYTDMLHFGFWLGVDPTDKKPKVNIGGPDWYIKFTGAAWDISLYSGLQDGGHVGMRYSDTDDVDRWTLEAVDSANVPFFTAETGLTDAETGLTIGYADHAKIALVGLDIVVDEAAIPDLLTQTAHTAIGSGSPHHAAVTLGAGSDAALALSGQELTLADVLTPSEHTAIGSGAPHHAAITIDANADTLLSLSTQALGLDTQTANTVLSGPTTGAAAVPTMRGLVAADIPALSYAQPVLVTTRAAILATSAATVRLAYATDTAEMFLADGTVWKVAPLELSTEPAAPDMGAYSGATTLGVSDKAGYTATDITDKIISNSAIGSNATTQNGALRVTSTNYLQVYLNAVWNTIVMNFVMREDPTGGYQLEHMPIGFTWWYEIMSGNSDNLGIDGRPLVTQYQASMGAYPMDMQIDGGAWS